MCGIAGYAGPLELPPERVERCLAAMRHRGPDARGQRRFRTPAGRHVHLLSTRLDIIDPHERANQPFHSGTAWLAYNGEIYNYLELRKELERRGRGFTTESDTEVLLAALLEEDLGALDRCEGMWAFALYDEQAARLVLCRDRFGEKPLYLYRDGDGLYWGSETKFIVELLGRSLEPDLDQLHRYLVNGYKALYKRPQTFFAGLEELPSGTALEIGPDGDERRSRYWCPPVGVDPDLAYEDAVAAVREHVIESVGLRLRADVPLAFCMSGGIDSLSLISVASRVFGHDVHGFTIVNRDERYDERDMVDHAVAELGIRSTLIPTDTSDFLPRLRRLVRHHEAPLYTISYFAHWLLLESIAAQDYRVSVSGTGADELFSGYYDHHNAYLYEVREDPELHRRARDAWERHVRPLVRNPYLVDPDLFISDPGCREHIYLNAAQFSGYLRNGWSEPFFEERFCDDLLRNRMLNELFHEAVPVILHEDDLNSMYFSVENRSPYLARPLAELAARIPTRHLIRDGFAKAPLRDAMRGIVPDRVLDNPRKVGFNAPILDFLDVGDPGTREYLLGDGPIFDHVRREAIAGLLEKDALPNSESKFLFNFVNARVFLEEFGA